MPLKLVAEDIQDNRLTYETNPGFYVKIAKPVFAVNYSIPLLNGNYAVTLKFAEIYYNYAGARIFDVKMEGKEIIGNLDIFAKAGKNKA